MAQKGITPFSELDKAGKLAIRKKVYRRWCNSSDKGANRLSIIASQEGMTLKEIRHYKVKDKWEERYQKELAYQEEIKSQQLEKVAKKTKAEKEEVKNKQKQIDEILEQSGINEKYQLFILHYLQSYNVKTAQVAAGYSPNAKAVGYNILNDERVQKAIKEIKEVMRENIHLTAHDILTEYVRIASADMTDFVEFDGRRVKLKDSSQVDGRLIQEVKQGREGVTIKLIDKKFALDKLEKLFDAIEDKRLELDKMKFELQKKVVEKQLGDTTGKNKVIIINDL
jgi:phage terminase small subunit